MPEDVTTTHDADRHRYETHVGDTLAGFVDYQLTAELMVLTHTEVDEAFEGRGIGGRLARTALDDIRERGLRALVVCPFIKAWIGRHPEYADLLYGAPRSRVTD